MSAIAKGSCQNIYVNINPFNNNCCENKWHILHSSKVKSFNDACMQQRKPMIMLENTLWRK